MAVLGMSARLTVLKTWTQDVSSRWTRANVVTARLREPAQFGS